MSIINTTSAFSNLLLASINSAFNSNLKYSSTTFQTPKGPVTIPLTSFLGNPNFSFYTDLGFTFDEIYNGLVTSLYTFITDVSNNKIPNYDFGTISGFRILITIADGNVFFDSFKNEKNTYNNFLEENINQNHGSRHYIQEAFHSKDGIGYEAKWSSTTKGLESYYSVRLGRSETGIIGVIGFSYSNTY